MRSIAHWTPRYVGSRLRLFLQERGNPKDPWLTRNAIGFLSSWLRDSDFLVEFGAGRSTLWFGHRTGKVLSIEHDRSWHEFVSSSIRGAALSNRVACELIASQGDGLPAVDAYLAPLVRLHDRSADVVLVDGIHRDHCAVAAIEKIKPGGLVIVDNANWYIARRHPSRAPGSRSMGDGDASVEWGRFTSNVAAWRTYWTTNGVTDTAIWQKPL